MSDDYNDGYEVGYNAGKIDGTTEGYNVGFTDGYDKAEVATREESEFRHGEHLGSITDAFTSKIEVLNSQISDLKKEIFELRIEHAATTRTLSKRT